MKVELEQKLRNDFPEFFRDLYGDMTKTCMHWGVEHGNGWFNLLYELNSKIKDYLDSLPKEGRPDFYWSQLKEKYGDARWYYDGGNDVIAALVRDYESKTSKTCEECGDSGQMNVGGWCMVRCKQHWSDVNLSYEETTIARKKLEAEWKQLQKELEEKEQNENPETD